MHQIASFILSLTLSPSNWIVLLLIIAYLVRKRSVRRVFISIAVIIFIVFGNQWLLNWYAQKWQPSRVIIPAGVEYSAGIVAGGFASPDADANGYFNSSADRFIQAVKLFKLGKIKHILISGGNGKTDVKSFREAGWVKGELIAVGIPDSVILTEDQSNNTSDNAKFSKHILDSLRLPPPYLLITSAFHMPRALLTFKRSGLRVDPFPCNYNGGMDSFSWDDLLPRLSVLMSWDVYMKETVGYWVLRSIKN